MAFKDLLNKIMGEEDDGFDEYEEQDVDETRRQSSSSSRIPSFEEEYSEPRRSAQRPRNPHNNYDDPNKVVDIHTTAKLQVVLSKPERFEDAREIADHLNEKRTVVLNLEGTSSEVARRLVDLLNGVAYANGGQIKKVANNTFIITPYNVDVTGDLIDELENTGVFF